MSEVTEAEVIGQPVTSPYDAQLDDVIKLLKEGNGYMVAVTVLVNGNLKHNLITKAFPEIDVIKSIAAIEKLAVERLKGV